LFQVYFKALFVALDQLSYPGKQVSTARSFMQRADVLRRAAMAQLKGGTANTDPFCPKAPLIEKDISME
jgi:hypothetical protein